MSKFTHLRSKLLHIITSHLQSLSLLLYTIGLLSLLTLPIIFSRNCYFSENAMGIGSFQYGKALHDAARRYPVELQFEKDIEQIHADLSEIWHGKDVEALGDSFIAPHYQALMLRIQRYLTSHGVQHTYLHTQQVSSEQTIQNFYTSIHAQKASGKESFLLLVPLRCDPVDSVTPHCGNDARLYNVALAIALMRHFSTVKWLSKDVILAITDHYNYQWNLLKNAPPGNLTMHQLTETSPFLAEEAFLSQQQFPTGRLRESLILDFSSFQFEYLTLLTEGINGELPNLDMLNVVNFFANKENLETAFSRVHSQVLTHQLLQKDWMQRLIGLFAPPQDDTGKSRHFWFRVQHITSKYITMCRHMWHQLITLPTGLHAPFRRRVIHAITLTNGESVENVPVDTQKRQLSARQLREQNLLAVARVVEGTTRSMNNLLEELHQSFFLYIMDSVNTFLGFEDFSPTMWLVVLSLTLLRPIGAFYSRLHRGTTIVRCLCLMVFVSLAVGVSVFVTPYLIQMVGIMWGFSELISMSLSSVVRIWAAVGLCGFATCLTFFDTVDTWSQKWFEDSDFNLENRKKSEKSTQSTTKDTEGQVRETARMFAFLYAGIGMLALIPLDPALAIVLGVYMGLLHFSTSGVDSMSKRGFVSSLRRSIQTALLLILNPYTLMLFVTFSPSVQERIVSSGLMDNVYEHLIYASYCLVMLPSWTLLFMLNGIRNEK